MTRRSCAGLAELRSAYVDGALSDADRERLLVHLIHCPDCRQEVAELRRLRGLLSVSPPPVRATPDDLSHRLMSIAGADATAPLWTRPFRRARTGALPTSGQRFRRRAAAAVAAVGTSAVMVVGVGYAAAPERTFPVVGDPRTEAVADFGAVLDQLPLTDHLGLAATAVAPTPLTDKPQPTSVPAADARDRLADSHARELLAAAGTADAARSFAGTQLFRAVRGGSEVVATARIDNWAGAGARMYVYDSTGRQVVARFFPAASGGRLSDEATLALLADNFELSGWRGAWAAGRPATVVEARKPALTQSLTTGNGTVAARWWLDDATGLVLWRETFDANGDLQTASGFTSVEVGEVSGMDHLPAEGSVARTTASLTLSRAGDLQRNGWACVDEVAGYSLVRLRSDQTADPGVVHVVYSNGVSTVSVFEERGELVGAPSDSSWDERLGAYVTPGSASTATWQSDDRVFTVVTDAPLAVLAEAVSSLPHEGAPDPTTMERVLAGWTRIVTSMSG